MPTHTDVLIVGAGSGGLTVAAGLSRFGNSVTLLEAKDVGGDCTNFGCIPSKSLLHHSAQYWSSSDERSTSEVLHEVRSVRDRLRDEETEEFGSTEGITLRFGRGRLLGDGRVEITAQDGSVDEITAENIILATGSRPREITIPGLPPERCLTNETLFELPDVPEGLAIVGAGAIGVEMATAFNRLGSAVTLLDAAPRVMPLMMAEASEVVHASLVDQGVEVLPGLVAKGYDESTRVLTIGEIGSDDEDLVLEDIDKVLVAIGRLPNVENLGLEELGVEMDEGNRIKVNSKGQTNVDGLWAVGDVSTEGGTTHAATAWGRRIVRAFVAPYAPAGSKPPVPAVVFSDPEAASIGTQDPVAADDVRRLSIDIADIDRGLTDEIKHGVLIVDVKRFTGEILGATVVGPRAGELISTFSLAMKTGIKFHSWSGTVWPYPTYADAIGRLVDEYIAEAWTDLKSDGIDWVKSSISGIFNR